MKNIAVFASGNGTNLAAIVKAIARGSLRARLALVVSDQADAFVLKRARKAGIETLYVDPKKFATKEDFEKKIVERLKAERIDLVVLAGFMRLFSPFFIRQYKKRIINIHPSLLPAFKGAHAIQDAYRYGVKVTGVTVHFVDEKVDHGPIIMQEPCVIFEGETVLQLEARIHTIEHNIYSKAIQCVLEGCLAVRGRRVVSGKRS